MLLAHHIRQTANWSSLKGACADMDIKEILKITKIRKLKFRRIDLETEVGGGIYRMFDVSGEVIYVGKSADLRRRLRQHLGKNTHTAYFIDEVKKIDWLIESNPIYQTLLEAIYIAYHKPKYNDEVKDAKKKFGDKYELRQSGQTSGRMGRTSKSSL